MVAMGTLGYERVGIAAQIAILAADLRAMVTAARSVNPGALEDPSLRDRIARRCGPRSSWRACCPCGRSPRS